MNSTAQTETSDTFLRKFFRVMTDEELNVASNVLAEERKLRSAGDAPGVKVSSERPSLNEEEQNLVLAKKKSEAIEAFRARTGIDAKEAKLAVALFAACSE